MDNILKNIDSCTGCRACEQVCPVKCISIVQDKEGFIYPSFDSEKCIHCGKCEKSCHMLRNFDATQARSGYFGRNEALLSKSSSGGAFSALTEAFLKNENDKVCGAAFSDDFMYVRHEFADKADYAKLRKSKYVFCDTGNSFSEVRRLLNENLRVLFTGTPCQISALRSFLGKDYDNLLTMDFICHGTPSILFYQEHLKAISNGSEITNVDFRSKSFGWKEYCLKIDCKEKSYLKAIWEDFYLYNFMKSPILRKCCSDCHYSDGYHQSDITVGDYWQLNKHFPGTDDDKGMSLVIANTPKGKLYAESIQKEMNLKPLKESEFSYVYKKHNSDAYNLQKRKEFMQSYIENGYDALSKAWKKNNRIPIFKRKIKKFARSILRR